jgi:hypothetical protein
MRHPGRWGLGVDRQAGEETPWHLRLHGDCPFAFAILWGHWKPPAGEPVEPRAIVTTAPDEPAAEYHDRTPVIVDTGDCGRRRWDGSHGPGGGCDWGSHRQLGGTGGRPRSARSAATDLALAARQLTASTCPPRGRPRVGPLHAARPRLRERIGGPGRPHGEGATGTEEDFQALSTRHDATTDAARVPRIACRTVRNAATGCATPAIRPRAGSRHLRRRGTAASAASCATSGTGR